MCYEKKNKFIYIYNFHGTPGNNFDRSSLFVENYPFGNNNFALWDMDYQYLDFFQWLKRVVNGEANIAYSFGKSLGDNTIGLWSFYLSSPFNLLCFSLMISNCLLWFAITKIGICRSYLLYILKKKV